jgi:hypothetical protein
MPAMKCPTGVDKWEAVRIMGVIHPRLRFKRLAAVALFVNRMPASILRCHGPRILLVMVILMGLCAGALQAPSALADSVANLRDAVSSARGGTSCGPLRYNTVVEHVAEIINRSNVDYINHTATQVPIKDAAAGLIDLGYGGKRGVPLQGAATNEVDAIKGVLVEGYAAISDCSYTDFGVSMLRNESTGYTLASLVLAGP